MQVGVCTFSSCLKICCFNNVFMCFFLFVFRIHCEYHFLFSFAEFVDIYNHSSFPSFKDKKNAVYIGAVENVICSE